MKTFTRLRSDAGMLMPQGADAKWCALFPKGQWAHWSGADHDFNAELVAEMIANWREAGSPPLPITLHHLDDDASAAEKAIAAQAQGWIEDMRPGTGDIALEGAVKWTDDAKALIAADKYRYLSPEWSVQHRDRRSGETKGAWVYGAALLNDPFFHSMPRVAASAATKPTQPNQAAHQAKEQHMLKRICAALRLSETATEDEVVSAVEKLTASHTEAEAKLTAAAKQSAETTVLKASNEVLKASLEVLEKKFAAAEVEKQDAAILSLVDGARREGKAMPEPVVASITVLAKHNFEEAKKLVAALPKNPALAAEMGVSVKGNEGEETPDTANAKLNEMINTLAKTEGLNHFEARMKLIASQPKLSAIAAQKLSTRKDA